MSASTTAAPPRHHHREDGGGQMSHRQILVILSGLMLGMFLAALDQTIVATAIRTISDDLHGFSLQAWATTAFLITSTIATPLYGKLSDLYGPKPFFLFAIVIFIVGSALCGLSQSMYELAGFRAVQGIGAGGLMALALTIIADLVPPRERAKYQGYFLAVFGTSSVLGPVLGGFFSGAGSILGVAGWRWIFYINVPIAVAALVVVTATLHLPQHHRVEHRIDWPGALALVVGLVPLLTVAEQGRDWGWASGRSFACYLVGAVGLIGFLVAERAYGDDALLPIRLFRGRTFAIGSLSSFILGMAMFGGLVVLPQYLQIVKGSSPTAGGLQMIPLVAGIMTGSIVCGRLIAKTGRYRIFPIIGSLLLLVALVLFSRIGADTPLWRTMLIMVVMGLGLGGNMQPMITAVQNAVSPREIGVATSSVTFFRQMGGTLGTAIFLSVLFTILPHRIASAVTSASHTAAFQQALQAHPDQAKLLQGGNKAALSDTSFISHLASTIAHPFKVGFSDSMSLVFLIAAGIMALGFVVVLFLPELPLRSRSGAEARAQEIGADADAAALASAAPEAESVVGEVDPRPGTADTAPVAATAVADDGRRADAGAPEQTAAEASAGGASPAGASPEAAGEAPAEESRERDDLLLVNGDATGGRLVYGRVRRGDGQPVEGASLTLADLGGRQVGRMRTAADGAYRLRPNGGGTYLLVASAPPLSPSAAMVVVGDGPVRHDVTLSGDASLRGCVRGAGGAPLDGALVTVTDVQGEVVATATTRGDGYFELRDLLAGTYTVAAQAPGHQPAAFTVVLNEGEAQQRDLELVGGGRVEGVVRAESDGRPVPEATVTLLDESGSVLGTRRTGADGTYAFDDLIEGSYTLIASGYAPVATGLRVTPGAEIRHHVSLGATA